MPEISRINITDPRTVRTVEITYPDSEVRTVRVSDLVSTGGGSTGTVQSVGMTVPTGLAVSGSPITSTGTLAVSYATGYQAFTSAESSKLSGIETGATADQSAAEILAALLTVDGPGSGLDADLLDGNSSAAFAPAGHDHSGTYQPLDSDLTAIAALSSADGNFIVGSATGWVVESGSTVRASLGVDAAGTDNSTNVTLAGSLDYLTISGQQISLGAIDLAADVTGQLPLASVSGTGGAAALNVGTTAGTVAAGDHTHAQLHDAATVSGNGISIAGQQISLSIGTGSTQVAAGNHDHSGVYQPADTQLTDLAGLSYAGNTLKVVRVNAGETGFELATISAGGGDAVVSGTLDQFADVTQTAGKTLAITENTSLNGGTHSGTNTGDQDLSGYVLTTAIDTLAELNAIVTDATLIDTGDARLSDARTPTSHDHSANKLSQANTHESPDTDTATTALHHTLGTGANQACAGNDARLSDARTPTSHTHGGISNAGAIGSTSGLPIKTGTSGVLEVGAFGTGSGQFAEGNHTHSDLHTRSHSITSTSDHTAGNWKVFHSNGSGQLIELALGADGTYLKSNGASAAPTFATPAGGSAITVQDEGTPLSTDASVLNFVGAGVTATGSGSTKTITIPGASGAPLEGYTLIRRVTKTSGTTHTVSAHADAIFVEAMGPGGGGAGATSGNNASGMGSGGGAGGYGSKWFAVTPGATHTVAIGTGGGGGTGAANGTAGSAATTYTVGGDTLSAGAGSPGTTTASGTSVLYPAGGAGGAVTGADDSMTGETGDAANRVSGTNARGGSGASSPYGAGGRHGSATGNGTGAGGGTATGYGAGGGGAACGGTSGTQNGGAGANGVLIIWEYALEVGGGITIEDEGTPLSTAATTLDFVGAGVTVTGSGAEKTITIPGGGGAGLPITGTFSASNDASALIDACFSSTYQVYVIHFWDVEAATKNASFRFRLRQSGPADLTGTYYNSYEQRNMLTNGIAQTGGGNTDFLFLQEVVGNASDYTLSGQITIWPRTGNQKRMDVSCVARRSTDYSSDWFRYFGTGLLQDNTDATGCEFEFSSGNITTGEFRVYGYPLT